MNELELKQFSIPYIQKMFLEFKASNIKKSFAWKERFAQPITIVNHSSVKPTYQTCYKSMYHCHVTHTYPEYKGLNYVVREEKKNKFLAVSTDDI